MSGYIMALDAGTTSNRAIIFDQQGIIQGSSQKEFEQIFPEPGWVEHNPEEIWATQKFVMRDVLKKKRIAATDIKGIGITNQRETVIVWERATAEPIYNAIVWQDRRTAEFCDQLKADGHEDMIRNKTGLLIDAYFSASKIKWILDNVEGARERAEAGELVFGTIDTWLIWRLTHGAVHTTDASNASRTMLYNIHEGQWDKELMALFDIPENMFPTVKSCSEVYGQTVKEHFGVPINIAGSAGDQQAALFGQMCIEKGMVKNTYGTGCFVVMNTGEEAVISHNKLLTTVAWELNGKRTYALEGSIFIGGAVVQWLRDQMGIFESAIEIEPLALSVPDNGGVYMVPAFVGLGAPHWDPYATGILIGVTRGVSKAHVARAALESICYQSLDVIKTMENDTNAKIEGMRVDGGAAVNNLLMQIQSDILQVPVVRPEITETTALGAAYFAGLAVGFWESVEQLKDQWKINQKFTAQKTMDKEISKWHEAVKRSKGWNK